MIGAARVPSWGACPVLAAECCCRFLLPLLLALFGSARGFRDRGLAPAFADADPRPEFLLGQDRRYSIVAARMPDCQRRHEIGAGGADSRVEVYAPGNDAWILKQGKRMYVVETRSCEGFAG
jgi:hypothetical protein